MVTLANTFPVTAEEQKGGGCEVRYPNVIQYNMSVENKDDITAFDLIKNEWEAQKYWGVKERITIIEQEGEQALRVLYPEGSINPSNKNAPRGGAGFNVKKNIPPKLEKACLTYEVFFPDDFEFVRGGKLPGLFGGKKPPSGCIRGAERMGFSTRYMWRQLGFGTLYAYIPGKPTRCGQLIGYGAWKFPTGKWVTLQQEIILNNVGERNGIIRYWVNGNLTVNRINSILRVRDDVYIEGIMFSSFFGGSDPTWASPKDQYLDFRNFTIHY